MNKEISFCITCKNRFYQISRTLGANLRDNRADSNRIEFVLVDFGSKDGLQDFVLSGFRDELNEGYLKYFFTEGLPAWHASIAKNTAHYYTQGQFLVNLDCDNFTGSNGGDYIYNKFRKYGPKTITHQFNGDWGGGSYGRIGVHRKFFFAVGGYDESFESMAHQDVDLINRLYEFGLHYKRFPGSAYTQSIPNEKSEGTRYTQSYLTWEQMEARNSKSSKSNIYSGKLVANDQVFGLRKNVFVFEKGKMIPCRPIE
jgi:hypothetical protein